MKTKSEFTKLIKAYRKEAGLSQTKAARHLNLTDQAIKNWEQGIRCPSEIHFEELCKLYGLNELQCAGLRHFYVSFRSTGV